MERLLTADDRPPAKPVTVDIMEIQIRMPASSSTCDGHVTPEASVREIERLVELDAEPCPVGSGMQGCTLRSCDEPFGVGSQLSIDDFEVGNSLERLRAEPSAAHLGGCRRRWRLLGPLTDRVATEAPSEPEDGSPNATH